MPDYQRPHAPGATLFFTVVTNLRRPILGSDIALECLHTALRDVRNRYPFRLDAFVILPDHLHCLWSLPENDTKFSMRWSAIKAGFTRQYLANDGDEPPRSESRRKRGERGIWQRRFWEHVVRDDTEFGHYLDYIHYNPVKHGLADCPHAWAQSSFAQWVRANEYASDWMCTCDRRTEKTLRFGGIEHLVGE